jgi:hypothetical protein
MKSILARIAYAVAVLSLGGWAQTSDSTQQPSNQLTKPQAQEEMAAAKKEVHTNSPLHLSIVETTTAKQELAAGFSELNCDEDGNIYLGAENWAGTIKKLNSKGELLATIDRHNNPDVEVYGAGSYTLAPTGELYTWVGAKKTGPSTYLFTARMGSTSQRLSWRAMFAGCRGHLPYLEMGTF